MLPMAAMAQGIRFSKVVSCGNECDLNAVDFLEYFGADTETEIIIAYLEAIKEGRRFCQIARDISRKKPIIIWKGGKTEWGVKAAASHTGALAGSSKVFNAALTQTGVISANSAEELLDILQAFHYLPLPKGRRVAIITGPGGPAVGTSDACVEVSLEIAQLSQQSKDRITKLLPSIGTSTDNPVDMGMATMFFPQWYIESIKVLADDEGVDMLLVIGASLTPDFGKLAAETALASGKPLALATVPGLTGEQILPTRGLAIFSDGRRAAIALGKLVEYQQFLGSI
jgi:acetyltransferase